MISTVADFEGWLHHAACSFGDPNMHDDLVQEGRIAMWRQEVKHGGPHAGFMTSQARLRMGQIARGEGQFGNTEKGRSGRDVRPVANLEQFDVDISPAEADVAEIAMWAYHRGQIHAAVDRLPTKQREAVRVVMADGVLTHTQRASWSDARTKLAVELEHLRD